MQRLLFLLVGLLILNGSNAQKIYDIHYHTTAPKIDGLPSDSCWSNVLSASDFIQIQPEALQASRYRSEVKMCYDNFAIYVFAQLFQPKSTILKQLTERDAIGNANADVFTVFFDTYNDKQNGYYFKVSAAGVQQDARLMNGGTDGNDDISWDAVWTSKTTINDSSWIVEMAIPYSAIRIPNSTEQIWGLQFNRIVRKFNERSFWNSVDVNKSGFLSQAGQLKGINNIKSPLRLFLFPYVSTGLQYNANNSKQSVLLKSGGMDIKYGINDAFTVDMTLIPDFSQIISDNLVRNISPFEQQLTENRPFFTEGTELFSKQGLFYSRRVGQRPQNYYDVESNFGDTAKYQILKNPNVTRLINATKISGRTTKKTGIGFFNALASEMNASIKDIAHDSIFSYRTSPLTNYNIIVIDQALNGQSFVNFSNASTIRANGERNANVSGLLFQLFNKQASYSVSGNIHYSNIFEQQQNEQGWYTNFSIAKNSGRFQWSASHFLLTPKFDRTDLGLQFNYNHVMQTFNASYNNNTPKAKQFNIVRFWWENSVSENYIPFKAKTWETGIGNFLLLKKSFWDISSYIYSKPFHEYNFYELQKLGIPLFIPGYVYFGTNGSTDSRKKIFFSWSIGSGIQLQQKDWHYTDGNFSVRYLVSNHFQFTTSFSFEKNHASIGRTPLYYSNDDPLVGYRHNNQYTFQVNGLYNFNPNLSINARYRYYNAMIRYQKFYLVNNDGSWNEDLSSLKYTIPNFNENYNLQNIDLFVNWIFKPGSRFILSYKQWLTDEYFLNEQLGNRFIDNISQIQKSPKAFELSARVIWFLDYKTVHQHFNFSKQRKGN